MKKILYIVTWPIKKILLFFIITIRPLLGPANCRFEVTCGKFAIKQLQTEPLHRAIWNIIKRLLNCANPFWKKTLALVFCCFIFTSHNILAMKKDMAIKIKNLSYKEIKPHKVTISIGGKKATVNQETHMWKNPKWKRFGIPDCLGMPAIRVTKNNFKNLAKKPETVVVVLSRKNLRLLESARQKEYLQNLTKKTNEILKKVSPNREENITDQLKLIRKREKELKKMDRDLKEREANLLGKKEVLSGTEQEYQIHNLYKTVIKTLEGKNESFKRKNESLKSEITLLRATIERLAERIGRLETERKGFIAALSIYCNPQKPSE